MRNASQPSVCLAAFVFVVTFASFAFPRAADAQISESVGVRAQGMAGAFTAVADDSSATWWNPAGLAGGAFGNAIIEYGWQTEPHQDYDGSGLPVAAGRIDTRGFSLAFPALGLSYYRLEVSKIQPLTSTGVPIAVRQDQGIAAVYEQSLVLSQFGGTFGQSLGRHFVLGATFKVIHGDLGGSVQQGAGGSLGQATGLPTIDVGTKVGLDAGAMAMFGHLRLGLMVRNLNEVTFTDPTDAVTLTRTARAGVAYSSAKRTATIALDADLTRSATPTGDERRLAVGTELWAPSHVFGVRAGVSTNTVGTHRTAYSTGGSITFGKKTYVDGQVTGGPDEGRHGWSADLRVTF
jgi:hypothetical protein